MHHTPRAGPADLDALDVIVSWPHEMTTAEVADELQIARNAAATRVRRLRAMGYVHPHGAILLTGRDVEVEPPANTHMTIKGANRLLEWVRECYERGIIATTADAAVHFGWSNLHAQRNVTACRRIGVFHPGWKLAPTPAGIERVKRRT